MSLNANSAQETQVIDGELHGEGITTGKLPSHLIYAQNIANVGVTRRLVEYGEEKARFETALTRWEPDAANQIREILEATRFIDWAHMAQELVHSYRSRGQLSILEKDLQFLYNRTGQAKDPEFKNIQRVNSYLKTTPLQCSLQRLKEVHKIAMKGQVEDLAAKDLGRCRDYAVYGPEEDISALHVGRINKNPYLTFEIKKELTDAETPARTKRFKGEIWYPEPATVKKEALDRIRSSSPDLVESIEHFQGQAKSIQILHRDEQTSFYKNLTSQLLEALCEERYETFRREVEKFSALSTVNEVLGYIRLVALHYRDMISIHPLGNGNGRSIRYESLYAPLDAVGISRPRLLNVDTDLLHSPSGWIIEVLKGIQSTHELYKNITSRILVGMRIENCPELVFPNLLRDVGIELRQYGKKKVQKNIALYKVDGSQFGAFVDVRLQEDKSLKKGFDPDTAVQTVSKLRDEYKEFIKRTVIICKVPGEAPEPLGLHLVDFDQCASFGICLAGDQAAWQNKIDTWHTSTQLWRGMCDTTREVNIEDIINIFRELSWITLSNGTSHLHRRESKVKRNAVLKNFDEYNSELVNNTLYRTVVDHIGEGPLYEGSFGLSTSRKWGIGAGFAWGRGALSYENKEVKAAQDSVKSRVLIGSFRSKKDIDVRRFRMLDSRFSYKFPRQQEVIAIGGIDPDSIFTVQLLDKNRRVTTSFIRNPLKASEIVEIKGKAFTLPSGEDANKILARHSLI